MNSPGHASGARVELGKHLLDKGLLDCDDLRCGKVDDLVLDLPGGQPGGGQPGDNQADDNQADDNQARDGQAAGPRLVALVTGPTAYASALGRPVAALARCCYRLLGLRNPRPVEVPWRHVRQIDALVRLDISREEYAIDAVSDAVRDRFLTRIPGA